MPNTSPTLLTPFLTGPGDTPPTPPPDVIHDVSRFKSPDDLTIVLVHADGTSDRWGPDEPNGHDIPDDLQFTTSIPGGDKDLTCSLQRDLTSYADEVLFDDLFVYLPGNDVVWNGYMGQFPHDSTTVKPTAIGWINSLRWDTTAREIYVERDLEKFNGSVPSQRADQLTSNGYYFNGDTTIAWDSDASVMSLRMDWNRIAATAGVARPISEAWFDSKGIPISRVYHAVTPYPSPLGAGWSVYSLLAASPTGGWDTGVNYSSATTGAYHNAEDSTRVYIALQMWYDSTYEGDSAWWVKWSKLAAYGNHGLTPAIGPDPVGYYPSDIIDNIVARWGSLLNKTYPGSIEKDTTFILPSYAQYDPSNGYAMLSAVNGYQLKDWGVYSGGEDNYPNRTFFLREPDPLRLTWHARRSDGAVLTDEGIQSEDLVNGVVVNYTGFDNQAYSVGPPGSGCNYTNSLLQDTDPTNPVNAHSLGKKYGQIQMSAKTNVTGATQIGYIWLSRRLGVQRRGTLTANGWIRHPSGVIMPACKMKAGDYVIVEDDLRDETPRKIVNTTYTHKTRSNMCDLEHDAFRIDALMEQMGAELVGIL